MTATSWSGRRVLVTGAAGFIGSWLVARLLEAGAEVVGFDLHERPSSHGVAPHAGEHVVVGTVEDFRTVERVLAVNQIDTVFHLAAQSLVEVALRAPLTTFESNIRGTYNVLEACRALASNVERVVVASSDKAYGDGLRLPYTEDMPLSGRHPYDVSKSCADLLAQSYAATYGLPVAVARCGNVYGGGDLNWSRIVPGALRSLLRQERPQLRSDGTATRDYIFVDDVVDAYILLADAVVRPAVRAAAFNFSNGDALSVIELVRLIQGITDTDALEPEIRDVAFAEIKHQHLDSTRAHEVLGWQPRFSHQDGLRATTEWYREYLLG